MCERGAIKADMKETVIAMGAIICTIILMAIPVIGVLGFMNICFIPIITMLSWVGMVLEFIAMASLIFYSVREDK